MNTSEVTPRICESPLVFCFPLCQLDLPAPFWGWEGRRYYHFQKLRSWAGKKPGDRDQVCWISTFLTIIQFYIQPHNEASSNLRVMEIFCYNFTILEHGLKIKDNLPEGDSDFQKSLLPVLSQCLSFHYRVSSIQKHSLLLVLIFFFTALKINYFNL